MTGRASLGVSVEEHARIGSAIGNGNAEEARKEGAQHHLNGKRRLLETL